MTDTVPQFDDEKLDRLEEVLAAPSLDGAMRLDEAQGFLCAALTGPQPMPPERWLAEILGSETALEIPEGLEAAALLRQFAETLESELAEGTPPVLLLYPASEEEDSASDYLPWCQAYLAGVDAASEDWFESLGEEDAENNEEIREEVAYIDECLFPLMVLTGEAESAAREHGEEWPEGEDLEQVISDCEEDMPQAVADIYCFWRAKRGIGTIRRDTPKTGRNDPCTCGSGKKFKQCCGAE